MRDNFTDFVLKYFTSSKSYEILPRICIKVRRGDTIVDWIRSDPQFFSDDTPGIDSNVGFRYVVDNGLYYIAYDIPSESKSGRYYNPRLDKDKVKRYHKSIKNIIKQDEFDARWCDCWTTPKNLSTDDLQRSCYKSTLIIPMTLINNKVGNEFKHNFFEEGKERIIWGFLCFDHPTPRYFNKTQDVPFGYICADIFSLYFISAYIHIERSSTFQGAQNIMKSY